MSHRSIRGQLGDYLEGDLTPEGQGTVERHLSDCTACSEELEGLRGVRTLLRGLPEPEPSLHLADAVMARLRADARQRGPLARLSAWWSERAAVAWPAPIAAAAMAMVAVAVLRGGDLPLDPDRAPAPAIARATTPISAPTPSESVVLASQPAQARPASLLPPLDACLEAGRSPQECIRWHAWMVGLAVREPHVFLGEVQQLPLHHQTAWMSQLDFAQRPGTTPLLVRRIPASEVDPR